MYLTLDATGLLDKAIGKLQIVANPPLRSTLYAPRIYIEATT